MLLHKLIILLNKIHILVDRVLNKVVITFTVTTTKHYATIWSICL